MSLDQAFMIPGLSGRPINIFADNSIAGVSWVVGGATTVTEDYEAWPTDGSFADRLVMPASAGTFVYSVPGLLASTAYKLKAWIKATSADSQFAFFNNHGPGTTSSEINVATSQWQIFTWSFTTIAVDEISAQVGINNGDDSYSTDILVYDIRLEKN
jgi:hypothetical protein